MIEISMTHGDGTAVITARGHATDAVRGESIVCAAVTILTYTLAECVEREFSENEREILLESGNAVIRVFTDADRLAATLPKMQAIAIGYEIMAEEYPEQVRFVTA